MRTMGKRGVPLKQDGGGVSAPANIVSLRFVTLGFSLCRAVRADGK